MTTFAVTTTLSPPRLLFAVPRSGYHLVERFPTSLAVFCGTFSASSHIGALQLPLIPGNGSERYSLLHRSLPETVLWPVIHHCPDPD